MPRPQPATSNDAARAVVRPTVAPTPLNVEMLTLWARRECVRRLAEGTWTSTDAECLMRTLRAFETAREHGTEACGAWTDAIERQAYGQGTPPLVPPEVVNALLDTTQPVFAELEAAGRVVRDARGAESLQAAAGQLVDLREGTVVRQATAAALRGAAPGLCASEPPLGFSEGAWEAVLDAVASCRQRPDHGRFQQIVLLAAFKPRRPDTANGEADCAMDERTAQRYVREWSVARKAAEAHRRQTLALGVASRGPEAVLEAMDLGDALEPDAGPPEPLPAAEPVVTVPVNVDGAFDLLKKIEFRQKPWGSVS